MAMRARGRRTWIKLYPYGILHGSIAYQLEEVEQLIWIKLLCLAGETNREGQISDNDGRPFPREFIAHELHTSVEALEGAIKKSIEEGRLTEDEHGLHIANWSTYQSEYARQKPYREEKKKSQLPLDATVGSIALEGEELWVKRDSDDKDYYLTEEGKKVFVQFDNESKKYKPVN